jgi:FkbM family methyltransferase
MALNIRRAIQNGLRQAGWHVERRRGRFNDQKLLLAGGVQVIFDCGGHKGETSVKYRELFPLAKIYSFEPSLDLFKELKQKAAELGNIYPVPLAVMDKPGEVRYFEYNFSGYNSMGRCTVPGIKMITEYNVASCTIDDFCTDQKIEHIDILKLDIQGSELKALQGAERMLSEQRVSLIFTEVMFGPEYDQQTYYHELASFLAKYGYQLFRFYELAYTAERALDWGDAIFTTKDIYRNGRLAHT